MVLLKPFVSKFILRTWIRKLEYKEIHLVCIWCGMYSHTKETCPFEILATTVLIVQEQQIRDDEGRESDKIITSEIEGGDEAINLEKVEDSEPWMLAKRRIRRVPITKSNQETLDSSRKGNVKKRDQMNNNHEDFMEGARQLKYSILDSEEDKVMEGDHTKEERNKMQMESHIARGGECNTVVRNRKERKCTNTKLLPYPTIP